MLKRLLSTVLCALLSSQLAFAGTVTGTLQSANGTPIANGTLGFTLAQAGLIIGTGSVVPITSACYSSTDGSVVGAANPLHVPSLSTTTSGSLPPGNYYVQLTARTSDGHETLPSPELIVSLPSGGAFTVTYADPYPSGYVLGVKAYIGTSSGSETLQGQSSGTMAYTQSTALTSGATEPTSNSTICNIAFNDTIIPYSGYKVSLTSTGGDAYPGFPQQWQLNGGVNGTVDISNGAPLWNGTVIYPQPIVAQPLNHGPQSISGPLGMSNYDIFGVGALGIGTNTPAYPLDVHNGVANADLGYLVGGAAGSNNQCLASDGTAADKWIDCLTSIGTIYYQQIANHTSYVTQHAILNVVAPLQAVDNTPNGRTDLSASTTGNGSALVTEGSTPPGASTNLAAYDGNGNLIPSAVPPNVITQTRAIHVTTQCTSGSNDCICTSSTSSFDECSVNLSFSAADSYPQAAFPTALDSATCNATPSPINAGPSNNGSVQTWVVSGNASGITVMLQNLRTVTPAVTDLWCTAFGH